MSDEAEPCRSVTIDCDLAEPPAMVWRALTVPDLLAAWLGGEGIRAEVGSRFTAAEGALPSVGEVEGEVLAVEAERLLRLRWRHPADPSRVDGPTLESIVTFVLSPTADGGTRLRLVHDGFRLEPERNVVALRPRPAAAARRRMATRMAAPSMRWAA